MVSIPTLPRAPGGAAPRGRPSPPSLGMGCIAPFAHHRQHHGSSAWHGVHRSILQRPGCVLLQRSTAETPRRRISGPAGHDWPVVLVLRKRRSRHQSLPDGVATRETPQLRPLSVSASLRLTLPLPLDMGCIARFFAARDPVQRHRPLNTAFRFSAKARTPSFESSETSARS